LAANDFPSTGNLHLRINYSKKGWVGLLFVRQREIWVAKKLGKHWYHLYVWCVMCGELLWVERKGRDFGRDTTVEIL